MTLCCAAVMGRSSALNFLCFKLSMSSAGLFVVGCTSSMASKVAIMDKAIMAKRESRVKETISDNDARTSIPGHVQMLLNCGRLICFSLWLPHCDSTTPSIPTPVVLHYDRADSCLLLVLLDPAGLLNFLLPVDNRSQSWSTKCSSGAASVRDMSSYQFKSLNCFLPLLKRWSHSLSLVLGLTTSR